MPRKGRKIQKDLPGEEAPLELDLSLNLPTDEKRLAAFELRNGVLTLALIQSPSKVQSHNLDAILRQSITPLREGLTQTRLNKLIPEFETCLILATKESYPQIAAIKKAELDLIVIERSLAIYYAHKYAFQQPAGPDPCLVVSTRQDQTSCDLIVNECVVARREDARHLSHRGIWRSFVESQGPKAPLARTLGFLSQKDPTFEEQFFKAFVSVWETGKGPQVGKYSFGDQIDLESSLASFRKLFDAADSSGQARLVVLSDWAASHCNLAAHLREEFEVIGGDDPSRAFTQALEGLVRFGLNELAIRERPELKVSTEQIALPRITKGRPAQAAFRIENTGGGTLQARLTPKDNWLKVAPEVVSCGKNRDHAVAIEAQSAELTAGVTHSTQIEIEWSDGVSVRQNGIPVSVEVLAPVALKVVKKLVPKREPDVVPVLPQRGEVVATQPTNDTPPLPVPVSPNALPVSGPAVGRSATGPPGAHTVTEQVIDKPNAPPGSSVVRFWRVPAIGLLVVSVVAFWLFARVSPGPNNNTNPSSKSASPPSENGNLPSANPSLPTTEPSADVAARTPSPFDVSSPNNLTPTDSPSSQLAVLTFYANTDDVHVLVDGTPVTLGKRYEVKSFRLAPGQHSLKATKDGYSSWENSFELSQGSSRTQNIVLQQIQTAIAEPSLLPSEIALGYYRRATELFGYRRYDEAIGQCNAGLAVDPNNQPLLKLKGQIEKTKEILAKPRESDRSQGVQNSSPTPVSAPKPPPERVEPALIRKAVVAYPPAAKSTRVSGTVIVFVSLDEQGRVTSARATDGPVMLRNAAVDAAKRCRFRPAREGGQPVPSFMSVNFNFVLN